MQLKIRPFLAEKKYRQIFFLIYNLLGMLAIFINRKQEKLSYVFLCKSLELSISTIDLKKYFFDSFQFP